MPEITLKPATPEEAPTANPLEGLDVNVSMPTLEVRMVNAAALEEYEIWFFFSSLLGAAVVGFLVAFVQSMQTDTDFTFLVVSVVFGVLLGLSIWRTMALRARIEEASNTHKMRLTGSESQT